MERKQGQTEAKQFIFADSQHRSISEQLNITQRFNIQRGFLLFYNGEEWRRENMDWKTIMLSG